MKKFIFSVFFISAIATLSTLAINSKNGGPKDMLIEKLKNKDIFRSVQNFSLFSRTEKHKIALKKFIRINIEFISKLKGFNDINNIEGLEFKFYPPKIKNEPILDGVLEYYYIIKESAGLDKGEYIRYHSWISRPSKDVYWNISSIYGRTSIVYDKNDFGFFREEDFNELNLTFKEKKLLKDIPRNELFKYSSSEYKEITQKAYDEIEKKAYAIYEFETQRNGHELKLSFTVAKDKYNENPLGEDLPYEWSQLFIERVD